MITQTKESQSLMTPSNALEALKEGNQRFVSGNKVDRDLMRQVNKTSKGQFPFATVLHCIDSRVSAELIFDQGVGDLFSVRIAGNFINEDILGSMEFATKLAGTKIVVVMGHTHCGAIKGACDHVELGNLTGMLSKITPVVDEIEKKYDEKGSSNAELVQEVSTENVQRAVRQIREKSEVMKEMEDNDELSIVGAMYDIHSGEVSYL